LDFILVRPKSEYQNQPGDVFSPSLSLNQREMPLENSPAWWVTGTWRDSASRPACRHSHSAPRRRSSRRRSPSPGARSSGGRSRPDYRVPFPRSPAASCSSAASCHWTCWSTRSSSASCCSLCDGWKMREKIGKHENVNAMKMPLIIARTGKAWCAKGVALRGIIFQYLIFIFSLINSILISYKYFKIV